MKSFFRFENLTYCLGDSGRIVRVNGEVEPNRILAVKGPSGSGKSTLLKVMARLIKAEAGEVIYKDRSWHEFSPYEWRINIHYVPQKPVVFRGTAEENLLRPFALNVLGKMRTFDEIKMRRYMEAFALSETVLAQDARTLSGGEAARISLIRALMIEPSLLLLDEPTAYLDNENRGRIINFLNRWVKEETNRAIILVSHQESDLEELDNIDFLPLGGQEGVPNGSRQL